MAFTQEELGWLAQSDSWKNHAAATSKRPMLVSTDAQRSKTFNYNWFKRVLAAIDTDYYKPTKQIQILQWGSTPEDLVQVLLLLASTVGRSYLGSVLVVDVSASPAAGAGLGNSPYTSWSNPDPKWPAYLPGLSYHNP